MCFLKVWLPLQNRAAAPTLSIPLNLVQSYLEDKFIPFGVQISPAIEKIQHPVKIPKDLLWKIKTSSASKWPCLWLGWDGSWWFEPETTAPSFLRLRRGGFHHPTTGGILPSLSPSWDSSALTSALGQKPCPRTWAGSSGPVHFSCGAGLHCFSLSCSLQISTQFTLLCLQEVKKKTKPSWQLSIRGTYVNTRRRVNTLAPPTPGHSGHFRTPSRTPASFPGLNLAICSPRPTPLGLSNFRVSCRWSKANSTNHLILVLLAIIGKKSKGKKATVLAYTQIKL